MTAIEHIMLGHALMFYLHGRPVKMYLYGLTWFENHPMPFKDQPIIYN